MSKEDGIPLKGWVAIGSLIGLAISYRNSKQKSSDTEISALQTMIPFGPFIALGALLYIFGLKSVGLWYVDLFFFN